MKNLITSWFAHPMTRGADIDDPKATELRREIVRQKKFLRKIYEEWYSTTVSFLPGGNGAVLELGSGADF